METPPNFSAKASTLTHTEDSTAAHTLSYKCVLQQFQYRLFYSRDYEAKYYLRSFLDKHSFNEQYFYFFTFTFYDNPDEIYVFKLTKFRALAHFSASDFFSEISISSETAASNENDAAIS